MTNYSKLFKAILGTSIGLGTVVGTNMMTKLFKVDRISREIKEVNNNIGNNNIGSNTEPFEAEFVDDDFVSDQEVEGRI